MDLDGDWEVAALDPQTPSRLGLRPRLSALRASDFDLGA